MNKITPIYLLSESVSQNELGDTINTYEESKVIARLKSIRQSEFWQAQAAGFKPEIQFNIRDFEYENEKRLKYNNNTYKIVRTYSDSGNIELICTKEVNTGGG